jgi:hypothetical protein
MQKLGYLLKIKAWTEIDPQSYFQYVEDPISVHDAEIEEKDNFARQPQNADHHTAK